MTEAQWIYLNDARAITLVDDLTKLIKSLACKECGGAGHVALSREPCSTDTIACPKCGGKGFQQ
jgi:hypothetical protein